MCLFCDMLEGKVPMDVVRETGQSVAFRDINPQAPTHVLVIPRRHVENLGALAEYPEELADVVALGASVGGGGGAGGRVPAWSPTRGSSPGRRCSTLTCTCSAAGGWPGRPAEDGRRRHRFGCVPSRT